MPTSTRGSFLHRFFRCKLPVEFYKVTSMQGMHIFRRDRTTTVLKCTPWGTNILPNPAIVKELLYITFLDSG